MGDNDKGPEEKITSFCFLTRVFNLFCCILFSLFFIRFQPVISYLFRFIKQLYLNFKGAYQIVESISFCQKSYLFFCDCRFKLRESKVDGKSELPVYNYVSDANNITWGQYMHLSRKGFHEPFDKALW